MTDTLKKWLLEPVPLYELRHPSPARRSAARAQLAKDYFDRQCGGFGAVLVRNVDQLFDWKYLEINERFLDELFTPEVWAKVQAAGRTKSGNSGATAIDGEHYHDAQRPNKVQYLQVPTDGKADGLSEVGASPAFMMLGVGMFQVAKEVGAALEEHLGKEVDSFTDILTMHSDSHTTYRHLDYPAGGWIESHRDTAALSVVIAKPGYQLLINNEWYEVEVAPWEGEGVVFIVNIGRTGSMWLTGDIRMATVHRVRTEVARRTTALFVHTKVDTRWLRPVSSDIVSKNMNQGSLVYNFALDDFAAHGASNDIPAAE